MAYIPSNQRPQKGKLLTYPRTTSKEKKKIKGKARVRERVGGSRERQNGL